VAIDKILAADSHAVSLPRTAAVQTAESTDAFGFPPVPASSLAITGLVDNGTEKREIWGHTERKEGRKKRLIEDEDFSIQEEENLQPY